MQMRFLRNFTGRVGAVVFNLGYLPGGDHAFTTKPDSTLKAITARRWICYALVAY